MLCLRLILIITCIGGTFEINLKDGGYENLHVIIHDSNKASESDTLLTRIKEVLTEASQLLFTATHNRVYFKQIKIIVPKSWPSKPEYKTMPAASMKESYLSVDNNGQETPQVRGQFMCGRGGHFMHLSPEFFLQKGRTKWGRHDRVIVHEWGHLRWGLYDEVPMNESFYQAEGQWNPVRCTESIKGKVGLGEECDESYKCNTYDTSMIMDKDCRFCPDPNQDVEASLMGNQWIDSLSEFCDKGSSDVRKELEHNKYAPTVHNILCKYKSAWEIMREHDDFKTSSKLPVSTNTSPDFEINQETTSYRVFVLDISGSMGGGRLETLRQSVYYVINELTSDASWIGIVSFGSNAKVEKDLTQINTKADRDELKNAVPTKARGSTCIGCGLMEAKEILIRHLGNAANSEIILISDGQNTDSGLDSARKAVKSDKIIVHTIAVSQQADTLLGDIAEETGGRYLTYLEKGRISLITSFTAVSDALTSSSDRNVMLVSEKIDSVTSTKHRFSFSLEEGLGKDTAVTFMTKENITIQLKLTGPNNYTKIFNTTGNSATINIPELAKAGEYELSITTDTVPKTVEYYVKSKPTSDDFIKVTSMLSSYNIDILSGELPIIFAEVTKGNLPVLNATVLAIVETGDDNSCDVVLRDNGLDPDQRVDDGIYSAYIITDCLHDGRVNVKVNVKGKKGEIMIRKDVTGASSQDEGDSKPEVYSSSFQRVEVLEQLFIRNYKSAKTSDIISPGWIKDVSLKNINNKLSFDGEIRNFTITWTATGDDKNIGQASSYIFRISNDIDVLLNDFDSAELLDIGDFPLKPQAAGKTEALKLIVDARQAYTETSFFAVQAVDEAGNKGEISNVISIVVAREYSATAEEALLAVGDAEDDTEKICIPTTTVVGDGIDNDCDGFIDEELCMAENLGKDDDGDGVADEDCASPPVVDGNWASWESWTTCSVSCSTGGTASGTKNRVRTCTDPEPRYEGKPCAGNNEETIACLTSTPCPIDGNWGYWGSYGSCSVTCATGTKQRSRSCNDPTPEHNGTDCVGSSSQSASCNTGINCPIDGGLTDWSSWGACSVTCGEGSSDRTRSCTNPAPAYSGASCSEDTIQSKICNTQACPIDGAFTVWTQWSTCTVTCGTGSSGRSRLCTYPAPAHGGKDCVGDKNETRSCNTHQCPIHGHWGNWGAWSTCTKTCDSGQRIKVRLCDDPAPTADGNPCLGDNFVLALCNVQSCSERSRVRSGGFYEAQYAHAGNNAPGLRFYLGGLLVALLTSRLM